MRMLEARAILEGFGGTMDDEKKEKLLKEMMDDEVVGGDDANLTFSIGEAKEWVIKFNRLTLSLFWSRIRRERTCRRLGGMKRVDNSRRVIRSADLSFLELSKFAGISVIV
ncbi:hypothetical protein PHJA_002120500 [Phtheirospermum japonicum]|uniref:Uncharacterized protein n=1 Tax=Phtheirospermum japonicum TaxID=374723 RepID=A0A830CU91_9LAMI|nr:hypothetical protein PHJA_002120500 [Phtheirospermum japonicum]